MVGWQLLYSMSFVLSFEIATLELPTSCFHIWFSNILISGDDEDTRNIQLEISTVLKDQLDPNSSSSSDKKLLSSQVSSILDGQGVI